MKSWFSVKFYLLTVLFQLMLIIAYLGLKSLVDRLFF